MIVQAGAARKIMASSPTDAEDALLAVEATGREAMTELRNLLGLLSPAADGTGEPVTAGARSPGGGSPSASSPSAGAPAVLRPQPGLGELEALIGRVRAAGLRVTLTATGTSQALPPGADLAAYRVVQEGLTNVLRHAGTASASVAVHWGDQLELTVTDDGRGAGPASPDDARCPAFSPSWPCGTASRRSSSPTKRASSPQEANPDRRSGRRPGLPRAAQARVPGQHQALLRKLPGVSRHLRSSGGAERGRRLPADGTELGAAGRTEAHPQPKALDVEALGGGQVT
jgi:Histidine kinase